jgi:signal transduction histidine kinase
MDTVKSELQDGQLQFSVSDAGVGLPAEKMDQIFSAFFTTKTQGSGMGLAISRSIVESRKKVPRSEGGTASFTWNKVKSQRARAANRYDWIPALFVCVLPDEPLDLAAAHG